MSSAAASDENDGEERVEEKEEERSAAAVLAPLDVESAKRPSHREKEEQSREASRRGSMRKDGKQDEKVKRKHESEFEASSLFLSSLVEHLELEVLCSLLPMGRHRASLRPALLLLLAASFCGTAVLFAAGQKQPVTVDGLTDEVAAPASSSSSSSMPAAAAPSTTAAATAAAPAPDPVTPSALAAPIDRAAFRTVRESRVLKKWRRVRTTLLFFFECWPIRSRAFLADGGQR